MHKSTMEVAARSVLKGRQSPVAACDPIQDPAWDSRLEAHPESSFFQTTSWARVLQETYGHRPIYFSRFDGEKLVELLPTMEVASAFSGRRGVSLPFTDSCPPLGARGANAQTLCEFALEEGYDRRWRYLEFRGNYDNGADVPPSLAFYGHVVNLDLQPDAIFKNFASATRRGIQKAEQAGLQLEFSN